MPEPDARAGRGIDRDRRLATLYAPAACRPALDALHLFDAEVATIRDRVSQPLPGEIRLQWWRDALAGPDAATGHPAADRLNSAIAAHHLPRAAFADALDARIFDLYDDPMPARLDLEGYCGEVFGSILQLSCLVLDPKAAPGAAEAAGRAACAQGIAELLRLLPLHRARRQCYFPRDLLAAAGTTPEQFLDEPRSEASDRASDIMIALGREHLAAFETLARTLPASVRPAFLPLATTRAMLASGPGGAISELRRHVLILRRAVCGWR